jgi:hypothetical protein
MCRELHFPDGPLKTGIFEVVPVTTSTLLVVELAFALVATTISFIFYARSHLTWKGLTSM